MFIIKSLLLNDNYGLDRAFRVKKTITVRAKKFTRLAKTLDVG